jgi:hypothetical protein
MPKHTTPPEILHILLENFIRSLVTSPLEVSEGRVMTIGPPPYRRLDCDGRALAYIRRRARKKAVRIDVSGLWKAERSSRLRIPTASGSATLLVRSADDLEEAVEFLHDTIERTRRTQHRVAVGGFRF